MIRKCVLSLGLALASGVLHAEGTLVEIVNYDCAYSRDMNERHSAIERVAERAGVDFLHAPLPNHADLERAWRERAYYIARDIPGVEEKLRNGLYAGQDTSVSMQGREALVAWLEMRVPDVDWERLWADHIDSERSIEPLERAMRLAGAVGLEAFPTYAYVDEDGPRLVPTSGEASERLEDIKEFLEALE